MFAVKTRSPNGKKYPMASPGDSSSRVILIIAGVLVLSALGWFATKYFSEKEINRDQFHRMSELTHEIADLEDRIVGFEITLDEQNLELSEKDKLLEEKYQELEDVFTRLNKAKQENKANLAQIRQYENRLLGMRGLLEQYKREIEYLKAENMALSGQVDSLAASETRLKTQNYNLLRQQELTSRELSETRQLASILKTRDFRFFSVRRKGRQQEEELEEEREFRKASLKELRICFTLIENLIAKPGPREIYLVYENPDGSVGQPASGEQGSFSYQNKQRPYTLLARADFNRLSQEVCVYYKPSEASTFSKGPQYISIYCDGHLIGQSSFLIR
jgi:hypothetical protein